MSLRHTADAKIYMDYIFGITDTSRNFRYTCIILVSYRAGLVNLPYGVGTSAKFYLHAGEIQISKLSVE
jgi:hypothetical protein